MNRFLLILVSCLCLTTVVSAQSNKLIKELESKRGALQQQIAETESLLKNTKKDVGSQLNGLAALTGQIEERKRYIIAMNNDVEAVGREISGLERQLRGLQRDLKDKKKKYESSVQYLYKNKSVEEKLMFIFFCEKPWTDLSAPPLCERICHLSTSAGRRDLEETGTGEP